MLAQLAKTQTFEEAIDRLRPKLTKMGFEVSEGSKIGDMLLTVDVQKNDTAYTMNFHGAVYCGNECVRKNKPCKQLNFGKSGYDDLQEAVDFFSGLT